MISEFHKPLLCLCCALVLFPACNRKVVLSDEGTQPTAESTPIAEAMEKRDESMLGSAGSGVTPAAETEAQSAAADESTLPGPAPSQDLVGTTPAPDMPVDLPMEDVPIENEMVMSDEEMLNVAPAQPVNANSNAGATPVNSGTTATAPLGAAQDYSQYEAWFSSHGLDLNREGMLDEDTDGDGYANRDEFLADTNPNDASSHPGYHPDMRLRELKVVEAPVVLEAVEGTMATVRNTQTGESSKVSTGEAVPGTNLKVEKVRRVVQTDKFGTEDDVSQLTVVDQTTGEETVLVRDLPARMGSTSAVLVSESDPSQTVTIRQGQNFEFPGQPGKSYTVIDLRETQVVVRDTSSGETWTIPKR